MTARAKHRAALGAPDANAAELMQVYRDLGCSVHDTHAVGFGFPDAVCGWVGVTELVEFKTADGDFTPPQRTFIRDWRGSKVRVVRTREDVCAHVTEVRRRVAR